VLQHLSSRVVPLSLALCGAACGDRSSGSPDGAVDAPGDTGATTDGGRPAFGPSSGRPFGDSSAFNTPIPAQPVLDPNSAAIVANLATGVYSAAYDYGIPVYNADASTPTYAVPCTGGPCPVQDMVDPLLASFVPSPGSDGHLTVIDWSTGAEFDYWQYRWNNGHPQTTWGNIGTISGDGRDSASNGAGVNGLSGLTRAFEIQQGFIDHAMNFSSSFTSALQRFPATDSDGTQSGPGSIPEGTRIQLDPGIDVDSLPGITTIERVVARALQNYGAYCVDTGGAALALTFEDVGPVVPGTTYYENGMLGDYYDFPHIPWDRLRVLRQWDGH